MSKKKVITVNGDSSKWYDKVIFVVKKESGQVNRNIDFVEEAESIISDYMLKSDMAYTKMKNNIVSENKKNKIDGIDVFLLVSICICLSMMFALFISM